MGIYTRDNLAANITPGLASALDRAQAYRARQNDRIRNSFDAVAKFAPVVGRTIEQGFTPEQYRGDKDYRAARYDYILNGDRSGLDSFRQREAQAAEAEKQRQFQEEQNAFNRAVQISEGNKNRKIQMEQQGLAKVTEKAKMLRDIRDSESLITDIESNPEKYGGKAAAALPLARAQHSLELAVSMAADSGLFTGAELKPYQKTEEPAGPNPAGPNPAGPNPAASNPAASEAEPEKEDWTKGAPRVGRLYDEAKTLADIKAADEQFNGLEEPNTASDAYQALIKKKNEATKRVNDAIAAKAKKKSMMDEAKGHAFSKTDLRDKLQLGREGGGLKEAEIDFSFTHNGKTFPSKAKIINKGDTADIVVDGQVVQSGIPLY